MVIHERHQDVAFILDETDGDRMLVAWLEKSMDCDPHCDFSVTQRFEMLPFCFGRIQEPLKPDVREMLIADCARSGQIEFVLASEKLYTGSHTDKLRALAGLATGGYLDQYRTFSERFAVPPDQEIHVLVKSVNIRFVGEQLCNAYRGDEVIFSTVLSEYDSECVGVVRWLVDRHGIDEAVLFSSALYAAIVYQCKVLAHVLFHDGVRLDPENASDYFLRSVKMLAPDRVEMFAFLTYPLPETVIDDALRAAFKTHRLGHVHNCRGTQMRRLDVINVLLSTWTPSQDTIDACFNNLFQDHRDNSLLFTTPRGGASRQCPGETPL
jgi:hypothetical protein